MCLLDAVGADVGFGVPDIDYGGGEVGLLVCVEPGVVVADASAGGVDEEGAGFEFLKEGEVGEVGGGPAAVMGEWGVEGDDVGFGEEGVEGVIFFGGVLGGEGGVVLEDAEVEGAGFFDEGLADVTAPDDADGFFV